MPNRQSEHGASSNMCLQAIGWIDTSFVQALRGVLRDAALVSEGDISEALKALSTKDNGTG